ncbi:MAG: ATP-grasp domain-containing protein [Acidiferrobacterales bacterium]
MPIVEKDPWREQYFEGIDCPAHVVIPTDDEYAYRLFPQFRWIYNKLLICETQGLEHAPHGVAPRSFPVFSKPIYNLRGMGAGARILKSPEDYARSQEPGHMWMSLLTGEHVSSDAAVVDGEPVWWRHVTGRPLEGGMFDYWTVLAEPREGIESYCGDWLRRNLHGYSGCVNFETIGGQIIEVHLRFADQWPDLYGRGWVQAMVNLYARQHWHYADNDRRCGYSVVLFGDHGAGLHRVDRSVVARLLARPGISSIQITFHPDQSAEQHAMPPGGFRLAVLNCWSLEAGFAAREHLAQLFGSSRQPYPTAPGQLDRDPA